MALLRVSEDTPGRMVITQTLDLMNWQALLAGLLALFGIFLFFVFLGRNPDATAWVNASCFSGFMLLPALLYALENLTIVIDTSRRVISRESKVFGAVLLSREIPFDKVKSITLYNCEPYNPLLEMSRNLPFSWTLAIFPRAGNRLVINQSLFGYDEMFEFGSKVARRLGKPLNVCNNGGFTTILPHG